MPMTAFSFPFRENAASRRFGRLSRLLNAIQSEISRESLELRVSDDRMTDCAAFAFEAADNGADMSVKIGALARGLADNRRRQASLKRKMAFVVATRSKLDALLAADRPPRT